MERADMSDTASQVLIPTRSVGPPPAGHSFAQVIPQNSFSVRASITSAGGRLFSKSKAHRVNAWRSDGSKWPGCPRPSSAAPRRGTEAGCRRAGAQGVVHVGDGHDPGGERDGLALQAVRVAPAVPPLMMVTRDLHGHLQEGRAKPCRSATFRSVSDPMVVWVCIRTNSSAVSLPGFNRMWSGSPALPMSWSGAQRSSISMKFVSI